MRVEADNLQEAFQKAADELSCSVTELDIRVIQHPRSGILGMFKKPAIIEAYIEGEKPKAKPTKPKQPKKTVKTEETQNANEPKPQKKPNFEKTKRSFVDKKDINEVLPEIEKGVKELVRTSCFDMDDISVKANDDDTVLIELNGEDAALLIGKEGYRYKAFSYLLYNWINIKYGLGIRLEIAKFLTNQETMMEKYLTPLIEKIQTNGRGQTKPLDGVLIKIALESLRAKFPDKYVGIKTGREGVKYIVVNEFSRKQTSKQP